MALLPPRNCRDNTYRLLLSIGRWSFSRVRNICKSNECWRSILKEVRADTVRLELVGAAVNLYRLLFGKFSAQISCRDTIHPDISILFLFCQILTANSKILYNVRVLDQF
jgi:hypothetical protein